MVVFESVVWGVAIYSKTFSRLLLVSVYCGFPVNQIHNFFVICTYVHACCCLLLSFTCILISISFRFFYGFMFFVLLSFQCNFKLLCYCISMPPVNHFESERCRINKLAEPCHIYIKQTKHQNQYNYSNRIQFNATSP